MQDHSAKLVKMANQIAKAFAIQGEARAVPEITTHIKKFWTPHMRTTIHAHIAAGGAGLEPLALKALQQMS
jgi:formate dehydrogenase subunit delta